VVSARNGRDSINQKSIRVISKQGFEQYFAHIELNSLGPTAQAMDVGCGSGRWARFVAPHVGTLHLVDPSAEALEVARQNLRDEPNCTFHLSGVDDLPLPDESLDFVYSLGVLHHVPDTEAAIHACVSKLKPGGTFLVYLYYAFDNRPPWFRAVWRASDALRRAISNLPPRLKHWITDIVALLVYLPLARMAWLANRLGRDTGDFPLSTYANCSFYTMRTDSLDRFGTRLEQRFTRSQIEQMLVGAGLSEVVFNEDGAFWTASGVRSNG
jgi:ubiquinone/menaquinone biosynthesis C-methylase UbiE